MGKEEFCQGGHVHWFRVSFAKLHSICVTGLTFLPIPLREFNKREVVKSPLNPKSWQGSLLI